MTIAPATNIRSAGQARNRFDELTARLAECQSREREATQELKAVIAALINAPNDDRPDLIDQHAAVSAVRAALVDEIAELRRQIGDSYVRYYRLLEADAQAVYDEALREANQVRVAFNAALDERTRHYNLGYRTRSSAEYTQQARELEADAARLKVDNLAAVQAKDQAFNELERARGMTARAVQAVQENKPLVIAN